MPPSPSIDLLRDKVVIITGASMGIGEAMCEYFAAAGASVVLAARSLGAIEALAAKIRSSGGTAVAIAADVVDEASVAALVDATVERFGRLDAAVNNAGMNPSGFRPIEDYDMNEFRAICDVKVIGVANCVKHEVRAMKALARGGSIVNHSSIVGVRGHTGMFPAASCSQAAVIGLTNAVATSAAPIGIRVNAIAIGGIDTGTIASLPAEQRAEMATHVPLQRLGTGADIAAMAAFLCSDHSSWITGALIPVDGGALA